MASSSVATPKLDHFPDFLFRGVIHLPVFAKECLVDRIRCGSQFGGVEQIVGGYIEGSSDLTDLIGRGPWWIFILKLPDITFAGFGKLSELLKSIAFLFS